MKKLALVLAIGLFSNFSYGQIWSNEWSEDDSISLSKPVYPVLRMDDEVEFGKFRDSIHQEGIRYIVYHYDSFENVILDKNENFIFDPVFGGERLPLSDNEIYIRRVSLYNQEGKLVRMIHIDPEI